MIFKPEDLNIILQFLSSNTTIQTLTFHKVSIDEKSLEYISEVLAHNTTIKTLAITNSKLTAQHAQALTPLFKNKTLLYLYLDNNLLGDKGIEYLTAALKHNTCSAINRLSINNNQFSSSGLHSLALMMEVNWMIKELNYDDNFIGNSEQDDAAKIASEILTNQYDSFSSKFAKINIEKEKLDLIAGLLSNSCFREKVGKHEGITLIEDCLKSTTIFFFQKLPKIQALAESRKHCVSAHLFEFLGGRNNLCTQFYHSLETGDFEWLRTMKTECDALLENYQKANKR